LVGNDIRVRPRRGREGHGDPHDCGQGEPWTQAIVGPLSNRIASAYGIDDENVSTALLIGPDGKIAVTDLWRDRIGKAISEVLGRVDK
jgi:hypothetical protein